MKITKEMYAVLTHFSKFADSIVLRPDAPFYVCSKDRSIVARATVEQVIPSTIPIYNIALFVNVMKLFAETDHTVAIGEDRMTINSDDGKFFQDFYLGDESILLVPKPEKTDKYFELECPVNFTLTAEDMKTFIAGMSINASSTVCLKSVNGKISLLAADVDSSGNVEKTNQFKYETDKTSDNNFNVGFKRENFIFAPGDYEVAVTEKFVRFIGQTVSYVLPLAAWSNFEA